MARILLLTDDMPQGGAERQLSYLAIFLKKEGYDIRLMKFYSGRNFYDDDLNRNGIVTEIADCGTSKLKRPFAVAKVVRKWHPDMVVAYKDGASMACCLAKLIIRFNLVVSERNTTQVLTRKEKIKFRLYSLADHIVPNSFSQADFIKQNAPWLKSKVSVITNMIDTSKFNADKIPSSNSIPQIVTAARIAPQKNTLKYLEAISIIKNRGLKVHFNWYGRAEYEDYYRQIKNEIEALHIEDMVSFHGSSSDIVSHYQESDIFCLPSIYEGFPNVLCEAMSCGLTCVASDVCDNPYILKDRERRFDPENPVSIANALEQVIKMDNFERFEEGMKNSAFIKKLCSSDTFVNKYIDMI